MPIETPAPVAPPTLEQLICAQPWPCSQAIAVARCESTMNPRAYNAGNYGLMQVNYGAHASLVARPEDLYDAETNLRVAYQIYASAGGWGPWACKP